MKYILIILSLAMVCCGPSKEELEAREKERAAQSVADQAAASIADSSAKVYCDNSHFIIGVYRVNDCEYISFVPNDRHSGEGVAVVHAGNCNNPIHSAHITHTVEVDDKKPY